MYACTYIYICMFVKMTTHLSTYEVDKWSYILICIYDDEGWS